MRCDRSELAGRFRCHPIKQKTFDRDPDVGRCGRGFDPACGTGLPANRGPRDALFAFWGGTDALPHAGSGHLQVAARSERTETGENPNRVERDVWKLKRSRLHTRFFPLDSGVTVG